MRPFRWLVAGVSIITAVLMALLVWPTPWRDRSIDGYVGRANRLSGEVQILCADGWHAMKPDPFADMAKRPPTNLCQMTPLASVP